MIPALIIYLCKRYAQQKNIRKISSGSSRLAMFKKAVFSLLVVASLNSTARAAGSTIHYTIYYKNRAIGRMCFAKEINGGDMFIKIMSEVKTRFVFDIHVNTLDRAHFADGKLVSSDVQRTVNGKTKEKKSTQLAGNRYQFIPGNNKNVIDVPIRNTITMLYGCEPLQLSEIYSDNFQLFLPIKKLAAHLYRISLPDGNYNDYYFENGICKRVDIHQSMYTLQMKMS